MADDLTLMSKKRCQTRLMNLSRRVYANTLAFDLDGLHACLGTVTIQPALHIFIFASLSDVLVTIEPKNANYAFSGTEWDLKTFRKEIRQAAACQASC